MPSLHASELTQVPETQLSEVHRLPSLHVFVSSTTWLHCPLDGSQASSVQAFRSSHESADVPTQAPAWHTSGAVHAFPSSQGVSSGAGESEHSPVAGLQAATWQGAFVALAWGFVAGFVAGWFTAFCRNFVIAASLWLGRTRSELDATRDFLDHI